MKSKELADVCFVRRIDVTTFAKKNVMLNKNFDNRVKPFVGIAQIIFWQDMNNIEKLRTGCICGPCSAVRFSS